MNVYVRELVRRPGPGRCGLRRLHPGLVRRPAGGHRHRARASGSTTSRPARRPRGQGGPAFGGRGVRRRRAEGHAGSGGSRRRWDVPFDAVHANYWLSGIAGHSIKHELDLPLVSTFHTLDRVKAEASPEEVEADAPHRRAEAEAAIIRCSDTVLASCSVEAAQIAELYGADPTRIRIVAPGVDHAFFGPGDRRQARRALGLAGRARSCCSSGGSNRSRAWTWPCGPWPALAADHPDARLVIVGGPSGPHGRRGGGPRPRPGRRARPRRPGGASSHRSPTSCSPPTTGPPTSAWCRAARSRSAWWPSRRPRAGPRWWPPPSAGSAPSSTTGAPATWSRTSSPEAFAAWVRQILAEPLLAERLSTGAVLRARRYTWARAAHLLPRSTTTSPPAASSSARDRSLGRPARSRGAGRGLRRDRPVGGRGSWPTGRPGGGRPPGGRRSGHRGAPLVPPPARGREGVRDRLADPATAHPAPRDPVHAGAGDQRRGHLGVPAQAERRSVRACPSPSGPEDAVYLVGRVPVERVDDDELDRIMGASLAYTDECFPTAMTIGYEGRYRRRPPSARAATA